MKRESVKRTTEVFAPNPQPSVSRTGPLLSPIPSHEWLGYFHGVGFADASPDGNEP
jgi:hypothetical protein